MTSCLLGLTLPEALHLEEMSCLWELPDEAQGLVDDSSDQPLMAPNGPSLVQPGDDSSPLGLLDCSL